MSSVAQEYRQCRVVQAPEPYAGLDGLVDSAIGKCKRRWGLAARLRREAEAIDAREEALRQLSDEALRERLFELRDVFKRAARERDARLFEAIAAIREAAARKTGLRPFVVQIMGALALHRGYAAEMATGEGKTLTASLAAVLAGWTGEPCHIVTVNDYLAQRDAKGLKTFYAYCGVTVGYVTSAMSPEERAMGYGSDVTYTTSKEVVADFLRDRIKMEGFHHPTRRLIHRYLNPHWGAAGLVMRGLHTVIIDEADSVLIDEAVTPLIISSRGDDASLGKAYNDVWRIADQLVPDVDFRADTRYKEVQLTEKGRRKVSDHAALLPSRWRGGSRPAELIEQALTAKEFFRKGKQYVVEGGKVVIVDESTGRMMPMRKWRHGLHQVIEAKEGVAISSTDQTLARMSFQRYFRLYRKISGMTGTAREARKELWSIYHLPVIRIPTNRPVRRRQYACRVLATASEKMDAVIREIGQKHDLGRPVLVGTRSVELSQKLANRLRAEGFKVNLLNALNDREEAKIISQAGHASAITIATNMAGRGTDILLESGVADRGGLHVIATEKHESGRIDRQLFGRSARQGDPGSSVAFVCAEDELIKRFLSKSVLLTFSWMLRYRLPGGCFFGSLLSVRVQQKAQKAACASRKSVMKMDTWLEEAVSFSGENRV